MSGINYQPWKINMQTIIRKTKAKTVVYPITTGWPVVYPITTGWPG